MAKHSIKREVQRAKTQDRIARSKTLDSFQNFAAKLGMQTDNLMSGSTYGFNPITRDRQLLEWIHRGSWIGGVAVDVVADDMTRAGVTIKSTLKPDEIEQIEEAATTWGVWSALNDTIKWSRLYGGALGMLMIDGQDPKTPLRLNTVGKGQFRGILPLDRWMVEPSLGDIIKEPGPSMGLPKYYRITAQGPGLPGMQIHHSRCIRLEGIHLSYWQRLSENMWGISVLERLYDRMVAFDSATTGAAQLVYKSFLRTLKIKDMREVVSEGGDALDGLVKYMDMMRRFQSIEGLTTIDAEDEFEIHQHSSFSGLSDALIQFGQQLSGALQIPLVRLFGQSPAGLNSSGESDLIMYYDGIKQQQMRNLHEGVTKIYRMIAQSEGIAVPDGFKIVFNPLWQMKDSDRATVAQNITSTIRDAEEAGLVTRQVALKELRQSSEFTGIWSNISDEDIESAEDELPPPPETGGDEPETGLEAPDEHEDDEEVDDEPRERSETHDDRFDNRKYKSDAKAIQKNLARHAELMKKYVEQGMSMEEASKKAMKELGFLKDRSTNDAEKLVWTCKKCGTGMYEKDIKKGWGVKACKECGAPRPPEPTKSRDAGDLTVRSAVMLSTLHGLDVVIENPKGSTRTGGTGLNKWTATLAADYGYIRATNGADGDQIDCYVGPHPDSQLVLVINQRDLETGDFDEHKVMLGFETTTAARKTFIDGYEDGRGAERIMSERVFVDMHDFKKWLASADLHAMAESNVAKNLTLDSSDQPHKESKEKPLPNGTRVFITQYERGGKYGKIVRRVDTDSPDSWSWYVYEVRVEGASRTIDLTEFELRRA